MSASLATPTMNVNPAERIRVRGLGKRYGALEVFRNIELNVGEREILAIVGPSGCGKTTLLRCIDGLLPHLPDGQLLVLRSTLYPGTTDWVDEHIKRQGRNLKVAFCPERIVQGQGID